MGEDETPVPVAVGVMQKEGRWYGVVPMRWLDEVATSRDGSCTAELLADIATKVPLMQRGVDPRTGEPCAVLGPCPDAAAAEAFGRAFVDMIAETLGIQRDDTGPEIRPSADGKGLYSDFQQENATNPRKLGDRPADWLERKARAKRVLERAERMGGDTMTLMIAAMLSFERENKSGTAFIMLARAVLSWVERGDRDQSPLEAMEARARAIAQLVADNIDPVEDFLLLICNGGGAGGALTHIGSMRREVTIKVVEEWLANMKHGHNKLS